MKKRHLLLPAVVTTLLLIAGYVAENVNSRKFCSATNKNCPLKQKKQVTQPQGSSPDEIHFGGINRLIVSTIR